MSDIRSSAPIPLGVAIAFVLALVVYILDQGALNPLVYSTYFGLVDSGNSTKFFEVAWLLATFERLLDLSSILSLLLWLCAVILGIVAFRKPASSFKMTLTSPLLIGGVWLIFTFKYANIAAFPLTIFLFFLLYRLLTTLGVIVLGTLLLCIPLWLVNRRRSEPVAVTEGVLFACKGCGATFRSKPLVCIECGTERETSE